MPEPTSPSDQADRIRRLQERRAAGTGSRPTATAGPNTARSNVARSKPARSRRRRPAAATRILLAGLSITSFFTVAGALAANQTPTPVTQTSSIANPAIANPAAANPATTAQPASSAPTSFTATPAKPGAVTSVVPHTTTRAS